MGVGADGQARQRIDKWLFFARFARSRSLAQKLVEAGHVRRNRDKLTAASDLVRPGDVLTLALGTSVVVVRVIAVGSRRGPPAEARLLCEPLAPGPAAAD